MSTLFRFNQDKDADKDYTENVSAWLTGAEAIASATWTVTGAGAALVLHDQSFSTTAATTWISGGTLGSQYVVTLHIVTNSTPPRSDDRSFNLTIVDL